MIDIETDPETTRSYGIGAREAIGQTVDDLVVEVGIVTAQTSETCSLELDDVVFEQIRTTLDREDIDGVTIALAIHLKGIVSATAPDRILRQHTDELAEDILVTVGDTSVTNIFGRELTTTLYTVGRAQLVYVITARTCVGSLERTSTYSSATRWAVGIVATASLVTLRTDFDVSGQIHRTRILFLCLTDRIDRLRLLLSLIDHRLDYLFYSLAEGIACDLLDGF